MQHVYAVETDHGLIVAEVRDPSPATLEEAKARNPDPPHWNPDSFAERHQPLYIR